MPYQLLYIHGDPESTSIHLQLDKKTPLTGTLIPKKMENKEFAVGYAFALYDHPEIFINPCKKEGKVTGPGYFAIVEVEKNRVVGLVVEER